MKQLLRQKTLWIAIAFAVFSVLMAMCDHYIYKSPTIISKLEKELNKKDYKKAVQYFRPDLQENMLLDFQLYAGLSNLENDDAIAEGETNNFITSKVSDLEDGSKEIKLYILTNDANGVCTEFTTDTINLVNEDGKEYISDYTY